MIIIWCNIYGNDHKPALVMMKWKKMIRKLKNCKKQRKVYIWRILCWCLPKNKMDYSKDCNFKTINRATKIKIWSFEGLNCFRKRFGIMLSN